MAQHPTQNSTWQPASAVNHPRSGRASLMTFARTASTVTGSSASAIDSTPSSWMAAAFSAVRLVTAMRSAPTRNRSTG